MVEGISSPLGGGTRREGRERNKTLYKKNCKHCFSLKKLHVSISCFLMKPKGLGKQFLQNDDEENLATQFQKLWFNKNNRVWATKIHMF